MKTTEIERLIKRCERLKSMMAAEDLKTEESIECWKDDYEHLMEAKELLKKYAKD